MSDTVVIYHGNCADGFTSAWVCRLYLEKVQNKTVEYITGVYQTPPPDLTDKTVYIVDFSYKRSVMENIIKVAKKVVHIDHHKSAIVDLAGLESDNFEVYYSHENTESGAMLTWKYFFKDQPVPEFIKHIDDRDRWQFKLPWTREINANVFSYEYTFENWDHLVYSDIAEQITDGVAIERRMQKDTKELAGVVVRRMDIGGFNVPVANVPYQYGSDICNYLCKDEPFAAYYYDKPEGREFGLRSDKNGVDVSEIASHYGGGGHYHSSGFRISREQAREFEIQQTKD